MLVNVLFQFDWHCDEPNNSDTVFHRMTLGSSPLVFSGKYSVFFSWLCIVSVTVVVVDELIFPFVHFVTTKM